MDREKLATAFDAWPETVGEGGFMIKEACQPTDAPPPQWMQDKRLLPKKPPPSKPRGDWHRADPLRALDFDREDDR